MISFCEQILLMLNVLMISYLLFNKEFNKHHCVKGIICLFASLVVIVLKKEISPSIINIAFMFLAYIFIFGLSLESTKEFIFSYIVMVFFQICIDSFLSFYDINNLSFIRILRPAADATPAASDTCARSHGRKGSPRSCKV